MSPGGIYRMWCDMVELGLSEIRLGAAMVRDSAKKGGK